MKKLLILLATLTTFVAPQVFSAQLVQTEGYYAGATPTLTQANSANNVFGVKFHASVPGWILGYKIYRPTGDAGQHVVMFYPGAGGTYIATLFNSAGSAGVWTQTMLAQPIFVSAGEDIMLAVSYTSTQTAVAKFSTGYPKTSGHMTATAGGHAAGTGVFPATADNVTYAFDVVFVPAFFGLYQ